jgi:hypothetical protein
MIRLGLSAQAFPTKSPQDVVRIAVAAGLEGVEWAAESHLSPGDRKAAEALLMETLKAGLSIVSFAALYRALPEGEHGLGFEAILDTASALQAPIVRIFAGSSARGRAGPSDRAPLLDELRRLGDLAGQRGITVCLSLSRGTALEGYAAAEALLAELGHAFVRLAWEPLPAVADSEATAALGRLASSTSLVLARRADRLGRGGPLAEEKTAWASRLPAFLAGETDPKMSRFVLLGRIGCEDEDRLREDAGFMAGLAADVNSRKR